MICSKMQKDFFLFLIVKIMSLNLMAQNRFLFVFKDLSFFTVEQKFISLINVF